jgi:uncharacterized protein YdaU (DUF1376 family)
MNSLPYLKFYPADWLADRQVRTMSPEARGVYWDLLAVAWNEGGIPSDPDELAALFTWLSVKDQRTFRKLWREIEPFWVHGENGSLVNPRQERERMEALKAHERRVEAGRKGGRVKPQ